MSLRMVWSTWQVSGHLGLHIETLPHKQNQNQINKMIGLFFSTTRNLKCCHCLMEQNPQSSWKVARLFLKCQDKGMEEFGLPYRKKKMRSLQNLINAFWTWRRVMNLFWGVPIIKCMSRPWQTMKQSKKGFIWFTVSENISPPWQRSVPGGEPQPMALGAGSCLYIWWWAGWRQ